MEDPEIIAALKAGRDEGARALVQAYGDRLLRSAYLLCDNLADAQELAQETLVQAVKSVQRFRGDASLYTWLYGILLNLIRSHHRRKKLMKWTATFPTAQISYPPEAVFEAADKNLTPLAQALRMLPIHYREVMLLHFYEGLTQEEIGQRLRIPASTVRTRMGRALSLLRKSLKKDGTF